ncbi:MAG TPA: DUF5977 domain-containing protein [Thermoclostridium sp.]|jgi:YD repeat-containing protein
MKYILLIAISLLNYVPETSAQITDWGAKVIPPSPATREFEKYINYNVSMYHGIPEIAIPIYTIQTKGLTIPITLTYHASGIKFRQENGEVGIGWTLNPGYRISRTMYGRADERFEMPANVYDSVDYYVGDAERRDRYLSKFIERNTTEVITPYPYNLEELDGEYDFFNFSLPSASGSFIISDRQNRVVQTMEKSNLKFNYNTGASSNGIINGILKFDVVDENGITYHVGEHQPADNIFEAESHYGSLPTAWPLTHITTPLGETVRFKYTKIDAGGWNGHMKTFTLREANHCAYADSISGYSETFGVDGGYATFFLDSIVTDKEIIKVLRTGATYAATQVTDINIYAIDGELIKAVKFYYSWNGYHYFLDSIKAFDQDQHSNEVYRFSYYRKDDIQPNEIFAADQWGFYKSVGAYTQIYHAEFEDDSWLMNTSCHFVGGYPELGQECDADNVTAGSVIGDFTDRTENLEPELFSLKSITYPTGGKTEYEYEPNKVFTSLEYGGGIRIAKIVSHDLVNNETLIREYKYGINESGYGEAQLFLDHEFFVTENIDLLILKDANGFDKYGKYISQRVITYSTNVNTDINLTGFLSGYVTYPSVTEYFKSTDPTKENGKIEYFYNLNSQYNADPFLSPLPGEVCVQGLQYGYDGPMYVGTYSIWDKPLLTTKKTYATIFPNYYTKTYELKKEEQYVYNTTTGPTFSGLKVKEFATAQDYYPGQTNAYNPYLYINSFWKYGSYTINTGLNRLLSKTDILYNANGQITSTTEYQYNSKNQVSIEKSHKNGYIEHVEFSYPSDFDGLNPNEPVKLLQDQNIIAPVLEKRRYRTNPDGTNKRLVNAVYTEYHSTEPLPIRTYSADASGPVQNFVPATVSGGQLVMDNTYYHLEQEVLDYDSKGNILTYSTRNGVYTTFIWDYNDKYPVAKLVNCPAGQAAFTSFESNGFGYWEGVNPLAIVQDAHALSGNKYYNTTLNLSRPGLQSASEYIVTYWSKNGSYSVTGTVSGWPKTLQTVTLNGSIWTLYEHKVTGVTTVNISGIGAVDELRLYPSGAQMTTYTYKPLIGIISQSDAQSHTQYYEYDSFGRLVYVRDQNQNILKKICYNYAGQAETCLTNTEPQWQATAETRCQPCALDPAYHTDIEERKEIDVNPNSPSYNTSRWVNTGNVGNCLLDPAWQNTTTPIRCRLVNGLRNGQQEQERISLNPCSPSFNQTQWFVIGTNTTACPLPVGNVEMSQVFTRTNCGPNEVGGQVNYIVPANTYFANEQVDANALAQADINANGQNYANQNGSCSSLFYSHDKSGNYTRNNCNWYETPVPIYVSVPAGMFSSTISQQDANDQATAYAQNYANINGTCQHIQANYSYSNNTLSGEFMITFTNVNTSAYYEFYIGPSGSGSLGTIPAGVYDIHVFSTNDWSSNFSYNLECTYSQVGNAEYFLGVTVDASCPYIEINDSFKP